MLYQGRWYKDVAPTTVTDTIKRYQGTWTPPTAESVSDVSEVQ